jgi:UDP-N-acetylglucosamine:LPS N-acetylglucosamine transferase
MNPVPTHRYHIAYFISPHGFGHAARAAAVMEALYKLESSIRFEIFTKVPALFFEDSLETPHSYHSVLTDIGLVQKTSLNVDLDETLRSLNSFYPFKSLRITRMARQLKTLNCDLIICDIAPMGLVVAREAGIPSVLVENFTWDWIYRSDANLNQKTQNHADYLERIFSSADHRIQTEPVCSHQDADLLTRPVSRKIRMPAESYRRQFEIPLEKKVVLITMGGITENYTFLDALKSQKNVYFIILGRFHSVELCDNLILLPHPTQLYHPDLVNAADAVIGKVGYGTLAEVYWAGVPFGYISRPNFSESEKLARFIDSEMPGLPILESDFYNGGWIPLLPKLLDLPRVHRRGPNGAYQAAQYIKSLLSAKHST